MMAGTCMCSSCPHLARLEAAKGYSRAQQAEIAQLQARLARYQAIGVRRYQQPAAQALFGTQVWYENVILRHALQQREVMMQYQRKVIAALKALLQQPQGQEGQI